MVAHKTAAPSTWDLERRRFELGGEVEPTTSLTRRASRCHLQSSLLLRFSEGTTEKIHAASALCGEVEQSKHMDPPVQDVQRRPATLSEKARVTTVHQPTPHISWFTRPTLKTNGKPFNPSGDRIFSLIGNSKHKTVGCHSARTLLGILHSAPVTWFQQSSKP